LEWVPQGLQAERLCVDGNPHENGIRPVSEDILIAKLRPGQSIALEAHCRKGIGKDHAKFSPVATASYRLLPEITFPVPLQGEDAMLLKKTCPMNVFDIEDMMAVAARPRDCTMCRECIRAPGWDEKVHLGRLQDHFIFTVETVGMLKPEELLPEALKVLMSKCDVALDSLNTYEMDEEAP
jgi:DNA-directed RNA polymerase I and III subunit RPAC1